MIRRIQHSDLQAALELTRAEGWPHTAADWMLHFQLGSGWAAIGSEGELLGTALWWPCGADAGTLGLVVVRKDARGRGIAGKLMDEVLAEASERRLHLVATPAAYPLYRRYGFEEQTAVKQCQGVVTSAPPEDAVCGSSLRPIQEGDSEIICRLDTAAQGASRRPLIRALLERGRGYLVERDGDATGFAMARPAGRGTVIGPVVADSVEEARCLVSALLRADIPGTHTRMDVPEPAGGLLHWLSTLGLEEAGQGYWMTRGRDATPGTALNNYGLVSQAFG